MAAYLHYSRWLWGGWQGFHLPSWSSLTYWMQTCQGLVVVTQPGSFRESLFQMLPTMKGVPPPPLGCFWGNDGAGSGCTFSPFRPTSTSSKDSTTPYRVCYKADRKRYCQFNFFKQWATWHHMWPAVYYRPLHSSRHRKIRSSHVGVRKFIPSHWIVLTREFLVKKKKAYLLRRGLWKWHQFWSQVLQDSCRISFV